MRTFKVLIRVQVSAAAAAVLCHVDLGGPKGNNVVGRAHQMRAQIHRASMPQLHLLVVAPLNVKHLQRKGWGKEEEEEE
jgi:hypothetical protein